MALKWFNIHSGETRVADTEPKIAALWSSSDRSPNVSQGQDFGWRLAPEVVVEMKRIKQDIQTLQTIATRYNILLQDVGEKEVLQYISDNTAPEDAPVADQGDYEDQYDSEVRRLMAAKAQEAKEATQPAPVTTTTTTKSLETLRAELAAREAAEATTTTTTTTKAPTTTTTTTKRQ